MTAWPGLSGQPAAQEQVRSLTLRTLTGGGLSSMPAAAAPASTKHRLLTGRPASDRQPGPAQDCRPGQSREMRPRGRETSGKSTEDNTGRYERKKL